jgi:ABC-type Zn uptake system ZnuABC Zn-binding protein ZnuA
MSTSGTRPTVVRRAPVIVIMTLALLFGAGCETQTHKGATYPAVSGAATVAPGQRVTLVATTTQIADFARQVGGDRVTVIDLIKPGVDPHEFEPTPQDAAQVGRANLIAINGVGLEEFLGKLLEQAGGGKPVAVLSEGVTIRKPTKVESDDHGHSEGDPHIWFDPRNAKIMVDNLTKALATIDPANATTYRANADAYKKRLDALDAQIQQEINTIPRERRKLVTTHDSFSYYTARYGLQYLGSVIPSLDTAAAPSAQQTAELVRRIQREKVPAIFAEQAVGSKLEQQIAADAGVKIVATLCADSLTTASGPCPTYLDQMTHDTQAIVNALR